MTSAFSPAEKELDMKEKKIRKKKHEGKGEAKMGKLALITSSSQR